MFEHFVSLQIQQVVTSRQCRDRQLGHRHGTYLFRFRANEKLKLRYLQNSYRITLQTIRVAHGALLRNNSKLFSTIDFVVVFGVSCKFE